MYNCDQRILARHVISFDPYPLAATDSLHVAREKLGNETRLTWKRARFKIAKTLCKPSMLTESHINRHVAVHLHSWRKYKVPKWGYSITDEELDPEKTAKASAREIRVSHKAAREVCRTIKGMMLPKAKQYLNDVIDKKKPVPYMRFTKKLGHRHGLQKAFVGRYPVKVSGHVLKVLEGAEANAENKGLDIDRLRIIHAVSHQGMKMKRFKPRAMGRASPKIEILTHIEIVVEERPETGGEA